MKNLHPAILIPAILGLAIAAAFMVFKTAPKPERKPKAFQAPLVEVLDQQQLLTSRPTWQTSGQLMSRDQAQLAPQVSGRVIAINEKAVIGGELNKGEWLIKIDSTDYQVAVNQAKAQVAQAQADLAIEQGRQSLAKEEYELSRSENDDYQLSEQDLALVLREPYLAKAEAQLLSAKAQLTQAKTNLARTKLVMPFTGKITSRSVNLGQYVQMGANLFEVINPDVFWLEVNLATRFLPVLDQDQAATVMTSIGQQVTANIKNVNAKLDSQNRQAQVLLEIKNPQQDILVNDFADVLLTGKDLARSLKIPQKFLLAEDKLWLVENNQLTAINAKVLYRGQGSVWIENTLTPNQQVLATSISYATEGMKVKLPAESSAMPTSANSSDEKQASQMQEETN